MSFARSLLNKTLKIGLSLSYKLKKAVILFFIILIPIAVSNVLLLNEIREVYERFDELNSNAMSAINLLAKEEKALNTLRVVEFEIVFDENDLKLVKESERLKLEIKTLQTRYDALKLPEKFVNIKSGLDGAINEFINSHDDIMQKIASGDKDGAKKLMFAKSEENFDKVLNEFYSTIERHNLYVGESEKVINADELTSKIIAFVVFVFSFILSVLISVMYFRILHRNEALELSALTDDLTGLQNRKALIEKLSSNEAFNLAIISIDDFIHINDLYGNSVGDDVILCLSQTIKNRFDENFFEIFRISLDEFVILSKNSDEQISLLLIEKIVEAPLELALFSKSLGQDTALRLSCGAAFGQGESLIMNANAALKNARDAKKSFMIYDQSMDPTHYYKANLDWINKVAKALDEDRIQVYFQPIYDGVLGKIVKFEALVRYIDENGKAISPYYFLEIIKKSKLYRELTKTVISKSLEFFKNRSESVSINISFEDIADEQIREFIAHSLAKYQMSDRVVFEILESEGIKDFELVSNFIKSIQSLGAKIAIDDFGSGYSNFNRLVELKVDILKIDGSLVKLIDKDENFRVIVATIFEFANALGMEVIAEFVHNKEVYDKLSKIGVRYFQGFYLYEPLSATMVENLQK